jgi:hypothetical protein
MAETDTPTPVDRYGSLSSLFSRDPEGPAAPSAPDATLDRLAATLERMWREPRPTSVSIKAPQFDGKGDVEYFLEQFATVSEANGWSERVQLLHLRESLKGNARDCGKGRTLGDVFQHLRTRYSLTPKEARLKLSGLRREPLQTLHEHAAEIQRLVDLAYHDLPEYSQEALALEGFQNTLGNPTLQCHL